VDKLSRDVLASRETRGRGQLILVVEDDPATAELMTLYLGQGGYMVAHAHHGDDAISRITELKPFAIILDIMLPGKDGWEILQFLKSSPELKEIPVIICSVIDNSELGFALGAAEYLVKPVDRDILMEKLNGLSPARKKGRRPVSILCIDGDDASLELLRGILEPAGYTLITSSTGFNGIEKAITYRPDMIILDLMTADMDGFEVTKAIKDNPTTMNIPIYILTAKDITVQERLALAGKIESYMQKSYFSKEDLLDHIRDIEITYPVRAGLMDEVSGLFDLSYFQIRLAQEACRAERYMSTFSLIMVKLDDFAAYIESNGLRQANICVRKISDYLKKSVRGSDTIARYGMDSFAIILSHTIKEMTLGVARRILSFIDNYPFYGEEHTSKGRLTASISITNCPQDATIPEEIVLKAQELLREIKRRGGGDIKAYEA
jgi:diguanylate cyclase (GGDEF)-like protein